MIPIYLQPPVPPMPLPVVSIETPKPVALKVPAITFIKNDDRVSTVGVDNGPNSSSSINPNAAGYEFEWGIVGQGFGAIVRTSYNLYQIQPLLPPVPSDPSIVPPTLTPIIYNAHVRAIDQWGRASNWSSVFNVKSDSSRVDGLRNFCFNYSSSLNPIRGNGGYFNDYNYPEGVPPTPITGEQIAVTRYTNYKDSHFKVNKQSHVHFSTSPLYSDRAKITQVIEDFNLSAPGETRYFFVDFDSGLDRDVWYFDYVSSNPIPSIPSATNPNPSWQLSRNNSVFANDGAKVNSPGTLRIYKIQSKVAIQIADANGAFTSETTILLDYPPAPIPRDTPMHNVRRGWMFAITPNSTTSLSSPPLPSELGKVEVFALDWKSPTTKYIKVLSSPPINLFPESKRVLNTLFGYNTPKDRQPVLLGHFDNIGFDAPSVSPLSPYAKPRPVLYQYTTEEHYGAEYPALAYNSKTFTIKIPDAIANPSDPSDPSLSPLWKHSLTFILNKQDGNTSSFRPAGPNTVTINGTVFPILREDAPDDDQRSIKINLPPNLVKQGDNIITFDFAKRTSTNGFDSRSGVLNLSINCTYIPSITSFEDKDIPSFKPSSHCQIYGCDPASIPLASYPFGAEVQITTVNGKDVSGTANSVYNGRPVPIVIPATVSSPIIVAASIRQIASLAANGSVASVHRLEFWIDYNPDPNSGWKPALKFVFDPTTIPGNVADPVGGVYKFPLDTKQLTKGVHKLFVRGYTSKEYPSTPYYFGVHTEQGQILEIPIDVQ